jgi:hypothetical protein
MRSRPDSSAGESPSVSARFSITDDNSRSGFRAIGSVSSSARSQDRAADGPLRAGVRIVSNSVMLI